jgi:hypothetical protein
MLRLYCPGRRRPEMFPGMVMVPLLPFGYGATGANGPNFKGLNKV